MNKQEWKAAEAKAIEGLTGAARTAAKKAFYEANKAAIRAANDAEAVAAEAVRLEPEQALKAAAAAKGLQISLLANIGLMRGSAYDTIVVVRGDTFACKDALKAAGAQWSGAQKGWMFNGAAALERALAAI